MKEFGDLTIGDNDNDTNGDVDELPRFDAASDGSREDDRADRILLRLNDEYNDFLLPTKSQIRFSDLTELDETEQYAEPIIVKETNTCSLWPCDVVADAWLMTQVICAKKCKLPCCEAFTKPHEYARRRRFIISKKAYLSQVSQSSSETEAVTRWADLVRSPEWQTGNWNERGILLMSDNFKFRTQRVCWCVMEEHLATLAYSDKKPFVLLAARICMEALAKNKALYTYSHHYWGFARICVDMLKSQYHEVQEAMVVSLQLYLRTLRIYHSSFSHKCLEYASAGIFPVLLNLIDMSEPRIQAMIINILVLMAINTSFISLIAGLEGLGFLIRLAYSDHQLLTRRAHSCLEVVSRYVPAQAKLIEDGILALAVRNLSSSTSTSIKLNCLFILNTLCSNNNTLMKILAVDNYSIVQTTMGILTDWATSISSPKFAKKSRSLNQQHDHSWCKVPRQNLLLVSKLCADDSACEQMVRQGMVLRLKVIWFNCETEVDESLMIETFVSLSRLTKPAAKMCQEGLFQIFAETFLLKEHQANILQIVSNLNQRYLSDILKSGLVEHLITCLGTKQFDRHLYPLALSILACFSTNDKVRELILNKDGQVFTLVLDTAFLTTELSVLQSCVTILGRFNSTVMPPHLLQHNTFRIIAYVDKLLNTGPDGLVLHGLVQLQNYTQVNFLYKSFRDSNIDVVLESLCHPPYKAPVQILAGQLLEMFTGIRSRRSSIREDSTDSLKDDH